MKQTWLRAVAAMTVLWLAVAPAAAQDRPADVTAIANPCIADAAALATARKVAVLRGARWMQRFLQNRRHLEKVSTDAVALFAELGLSARDDDIRELALATARRFVPVIAATFLRPRGLATAVALRDALWLVALAHELGVPHESLLNAAKKRFHALPSPNAIYDVDVEKIDGVSSDDVFQVLIGAHAIERARLAYPGNFEVPFGLAETLAAVGRRRWVRDAADPSPKHEAFREDAYLVTHIGFVLSDYGRLALPAAQLPRTRKYLDDHFEVLREREDIELVAEILDLARSNGESERTDVRWCRATRLLLAEQNKDGSWGDWRKEKIPYDALHPVWTAVHALRARTVMHATPFARRVAQLLAGLKDL